MISLYCTILILCMYSAPLYSRDSIHRNYQQLQVLPVKSNIGDFLQEPKLSGTWFSEKGPTPVFSSTQLNGTSVYVQLGFDALLGCEVTSVEDNLVSWFLVYTSHHHTSTSLTLLTVGFQTYSSDMRFQLDFKKPNNYRLRVHNVQLHDEGYYHCQLSTHPPQIIWTILRIVPPSVRILDNENNTVTEIHHHLHSKLSIHCHISKGPRFASSVVWRFTKETDSTRTSIILNQSLERGGIRISTWREEDGEIFSHLEMVRVGLEDQGNYTCSLPDDLARIATQTFRLYISKESWEPVLNCCNSVVMFPLVELVGRLLLGYLQTTVL